MNFSYYPKCWALEANFYMLQIQVFLHHSVLHCANFWVLLKNISIAVKIKREKETETETETETERDRDREQTSPLSFIFIHLFNKIWYICRNWAMRQLLLILLFSNGNVNLAKNLQLFIIFSPTPPPPPHTHTHTPTSRNVKWGYFVTKLIYGWLWSDVNWSRYSPTLMGMYCKNDSIQVKKIKVLCVILWMVQNLWAHSK